MKAISKISVVTKGIRKPSVSNFNTINAKVANLHHSSFKREHFSQISGKSDKGGIAPSKPTVVTAGE